MLKPGVTLKFAVLPMMVAPVPAVPAVIELVLYPKDSIFLVIIDIVTFTTPVFFTLVTSRPSPCATNFVSKNCFCCVALRCVAWRCVAWRLVCGTRFRAGEGEKKEGKKGDKRILLFYRARILTSGCVPVTQAINLCKMLLLMGRYMCTYLTCVPGLVGIKSDPYPRTTSRPIPSTPYTESAKRGHPNAFVALKVTSIGKFQITLWSCDPKKEEGRGGGEGENMHVHIQISYTYKNRHVHIHIHIRICI